MVFQFSQCNPSFYIPNCIHIYNIYKQTNSKDTKVETLRKRKYPEMPMTMFGWWVPSLMMHQLSDEVRSRFSSRWSCCKMGSPLNLTRFINGVLLWSAVIGFRNKSISSSELRVWWVVLFFGFFFSEILRSNSHSYRIFKSPLHRQTLIKPVWDRRRVTSEVAWSWGRRRRSLSEG